jgi:hypothetical protein
MACPFFYPVARLEMSSWAVPPRLPLGDAYTGECRALGEASPPDEALIIDCCNMGYCRGRCPRFPSHSTADAVRFHIAYQTEAWIRIQYVFEKDCWPVLYGTAEFSIAGRAFSPELADKILRRQAEAFLESYWRRIGQ